MCVPSLPGNALQIDTCNGCALFFAGMVWLVWLVWYGMIWFGLVVWFCMVGLFVSMVGMVGIALATSHPPTLISFPKSPYLLFVLFVHAVFGVVGNLFFVFFCLYTYTIFFVGGV